MALCKVTISEREVIHKQWGVVLVKGSNTLSKNEFITKLIRSELVILVEGKNDVIRLDKLGITKVISLSQKPLYLFCEEISQKYNEVIILMDNDVEGRKLYSKLTTEFSRLGIKTNPKYQKMLADLKISHVEGIKKGD